MPKMNGQGVISTQSEWRLLQQLLKKKKKITSCDSPNEVIKNGYRHR